MPKGEGGCKTGHGVITPNRKTADHRQRLIHYPRTGKSVKESGKCIAIMGG
ncbi:MAG: hypothetical protein ACRCUY_11150 [Thermoguttaceae bacterium]